MAITYYKRFRMEIDLDRAITTAVLPQFFTWVPWDEALLEVSSEADLFVCRRCETETPARGYVPMKDLLASSAR